MCGTPPTARAGRFAITYDMSGQATNTLFSQLTNDWRWLVDNTHITQDPRYLHHNGKPVLMIWGFFSDRFSADLANQIIDFFKTNATYGVTLVGGGEWWWQRTQLPAGRTCSGASTFIARGTREIIIPTARHKYASTGLLVAGPGGGNERGDVLSAGNLSGFQLG